MTVCPRGAPRIMHFDVSSFLDPTAEDDIAAIDERSEWHFVEG